MRPCCVAAFRRMKKSCAAQAPSLTLPPAVVQVRRAFGSFLVKVCCRPGGEGEGLEIVAGAALE